MSVSDQILVLECSAPVLVTNYFSGNKPRTLVEEVIPMPYNDPDASKETLPRQLYAALMGLLCTSGATIMKGPHNWHFPRSTVLKLSSTDLVFLQWLMDLFTPYLEWNPIRNASLKGASSSLAAVSLDSFYLYILRMHWQHEGLHLLPIHFEEYFDWITLAFWAMRNGQWTNNYFVIGVSRLNVSERQRLIDVLESKLGLSSKLIMGGKKLAISDPQRVVDNISPHFHGSQLYRLSKISR
ncbi:MAG: hypothetical protein H9W80_06820 [Enterococcus sp.]|jgi:hypothetical protein|nr:hypothetical protein [Enterococcus sp.]